MNQPSTTGSLASETTGTSKLFFANVTCLGDKAWKYILHDVCIDHDYIGLCETHIGRAATAPWANAARQQSLKSFFNPARPKSREAALKPGGEGYANEGGELILVKNHRAAQLLDEARSATGLKAARGGSNSFDGFVPCVFHMRGFAIAVFVFYGISGIGMCNENVSRFRKLGGLLRALQLPWIVVAD